MTSDESGNAQNNGEFSLHNQPEYSVSGISQALKRTVEGAFSHVRVRGEISGCKRAASGHIYLDLKDDKAVLNGICWRGVASKLAVQPENGLDVICTGRLTTYPGRSNYQLIIEHIELAGLGALMALLEKRKAAMASEGLFDTARKQPLPFLPEVIGVVTSPTGSVIRDILHRIAERCPRHVLVWPTAVQGKGADEQIAAAIEGFNRFDGVTSLPRPDVIIVARGGGSMEDLWCFNEERPVRAAAASAIPIISAVGHETDTTLIDYVSSKRAPTPTAAAEIAVPVLADLQYEVTQYGLHLQRAATQKIQTCGLQLTSASRGLITPAAMLESNIQRLDEWSERLMRAITQRQNDAARSLEIITTRLTPAALQRRIDQQYDQLHYCAASLAQQIDARFQHSRLHLAGLAERCSPYAILQHVARTEKETTQQYRRLQSQLLSIIDQRSESLNSRVRMLEALNVTALLARGYAYVTDQENNVVSSVKHVSQHPLTLHLRDGEIKIVKYRASSKAATSAVPRQQSLL